MKYREIDYRTSNNERAKRMRLSRKEQTKFIAPTCIAYSSERINDANLIKPYHSFIRDIVHALDIKKIQTFPVQDIKKEDKNSKEYVFPVHFDMASATYRFLNSKKMQDIVFYLPRDKFIQLQQKVTEYPAELRINNH